MNNARMYLSSRNVGQLIDLGYHVTLVADTWNVLKPHLGLRQSGFYREVAEWAGLFLCGDLLFWK